MVHSEGALTHDHPVLMVPCWIPFSLSRSTLHGARSPSRVERSIVVACACVCVRTTHTPHRASRAVCAGMLCDGVCLLPSFAWTCPLVFSPYLRAAVPGSAGLSLRWSRLPSRNMEDLPAVEPVKIYENTYRLEPADNEK